MCWVRLLAEASRIVTYVIQGFWYEYQIIDGVCGRVKINCCFTDMSRLTARGDGHAFDIFYEMLTGLSAEEKGSLRNAVCFLPYTRALWITTSVKFHLGGMDASKLRYLKEGSSTVDGRRRFNAWKSALFILGIPFSDVMRVLAACLLLGNVQFIESEGDEVELEGQHGALSAALHLPTLIYSGIYFSRTGVRRGFARSVGVISLQSAHEAYQTD